MSTIYITSNNGILQKDGDILIYQDHTGLRVKVAPRMVDLIIVLGNMSLTGPAIDLLLQQTIPVFFLQKNGKWNGKLIGSDNQNTLLRHKQHVLAEDSKFIATMAQDIVRGKLKNELLYLQKIQRKLNKPSLTKNVERISWILDKLDNTKDVDEVRGYEGNAARLYFEGLSVNLLPDWVSFQRRTKNPPRDPVNSVLSFLYTVLACKIDSLLLREGLDDTVGTLHAMSYGRKSLVFDLVEEYRTPLVDTTVCALFNQGMLKKTDFTEEKDVESGDKKVLLGPKSMKVVLDQFESKLSQTHRYNDSASSLPYRSIMERQIQQYKQVLGGFTDHYHPLVVT
ncbi:MAG: CRISPR-associated endonuclease Cas1 [Sphaerochaetaceae bacterium]|nr:CRISPR-associated endonuclease Cas1 [Spirochaetales bacterium]MDY5500215.1 CRISPR-associated endonuclease Cas1 [Sphaerochaetaceae bacterium]